MTTDQGPQCQSAEQWARVSISTEISTSVNPVIPSKVRYYLNSAMSRPHVPASSDEQGKLTIAALVIFPTCNIQFIVHLLQREAEHEAAPSLTAPGDNNRYRVCNFFALVLQSSVFGNVWFM